MIGSRPGAAERWDCHVHLFGPAARFPYAPQRRYTPRDALPADLRATLRSLGATRAVVVQASVFGDDHACLLSGLEALGDAAYGVAALVQHLDPRVLRHPRVVGLRLNLYGLGDALEAKRRVAEAAVHAREHGWHLELHVDGAWLPALELDALPVDFVLDHMGRLRADEAAGLATLRALLRTGRCWVKLSGADRVGPHAPGLARALLEERPDRLVWGSDWPHVPLEQARDEIRQVDTPALLAALMQWTGERELTEQVLSRNPAALYARRR